MKTRKIYSFVVAFLLSGALMNAQLVVKEELPEQLYSGTQDPAATGWSPLLLNSGNNGAAGASSASVADDLLKIAGGGDNKFSQAAFYTTNLDLDPNTGYTIEIKAKVIKSKGNGSFTFQGFDMEGKGFRLGIYEDAIVESTNPLAKTNKLRDIDNNTGEFHVYRLAVQANGTVSVFRDNKAMGTFKISSFQYDNFFVNGGFEDAAGSLNAQANFPQFYSDEDQEMKILAKEGNESNVRTGNYGLYMNNNGIINDKPAEADWDNPGADLIGIGKVNTVDFPVKMGHRYGISFDAKRAVAEDLNAWRDVGLFYDFQYGCQDIYEDLRNWRAWWSDANTNDWATQSGSFTASRATYDTSELEEDPKSVRLEFPTWERDGRKVSQHVFDNFYLYEDLDLQRGILVSSPENAFAPKAIPDYAVNLYGSESTRPNGANPGFEVTTPSQTPSGTTARYSTSQSGEAWTFAVNGNTNARVNQQYGWYSKVRIQWHTGDVDNGSDTRTAQINHTPSGRFSLRASSIEDNDHASAQRLQYRKQLEKNKTYRFNYWFRSANYNDPGAIMFKLADELVPSGRFSTSNSATTRADNWFADGRDLREGIDIGETYVMDHTDWTNDEIEFTTTDENFVFVMTSRQPFKHDNGYKGWHHIYFDDLFLYEVNETEEMLGGLTNLFPNGGFEDDTKDVRGNDYTWAKASFAPNPNNDNYPVKYSPEWKGYVRLQDCGKNDQDDTFFKHARSGNNSLRIAYSEDDGAATNFLSNIGQYTPEGFDYNLNVTEQGRPWRQNVHFEYPLEIGKTYTFRFWFKTASYPDYGHFYVANGDVTLWGGGFSREINWRQYSVTFNTTESNHTLRYYTEFGSWYNFYLDDLELYQHTETLPFSGGDSFVQFGKSTGIEEMEVEIAYIKFDNTGAYSPYAPATDATLSGITIDETAIEDFDSATLEYSYEVNYGRADFPIVAYTTTDENAEVEVTPITAYPGEYLIDVTAEDGVTTKQYKISFTMAAPATNATLSAITVDETALEGFDSETLEYSYVVAYGREEMPVVTYTITDENATAVATEITAYPGDYLIDVTAEDGTTTLQYKISFTMAPNADATLSEITVDGTALEGFEKTTTNYIVEVSYDRVSMPEVTYTTSDENADAVDTPITTYPGDYLIDVTAEDGTTKLQYKITFTKKEHNSMGDVNAAIYVYVEDGIAYVVGVEAGTTIDLCDVTGKLIQKTTDTAITLGAKGTYLIKVGTQTFKVVN